MSDMYNRYKNDSMDNLQSNIQRAVKAYQDPNLPADKKEKVRELLVKFRNELKVREKLKSYKDAGGVFGESEGDNILDTIGRYTDSAARGITGGYLEEATAKVKSLFSDKDYDELLTEEELRSEFLDRVKGEYDSSLLHGGTEVAGAVASTLIPVGNLGKLGTFGQVAKANPLKTTIGAGGLSAGIYGASGPGSLGERVEEGIKTIPYGIAGGMLGPSIVKTGQILKSKVGDKAGGLLSKKADDLVEETGSSGLAGAVGKKVIGTLGKKVGLDKPSKSVMKIAKDYGKKMADGKFQALTGRVASGGLTIAQAQYQLWRDSFNFLIKNGIKLFIDRTGKAPTAAQKKAMKQSAKEQSDTWLEEFFGAKPKAKPKNKKPTKTKSKTNAKSKTQTKSKKAPTSKPKLKVVNKDGKQYFQSQDGTFLDPATMTPIKNLKYGGLLTKPKKSVKKGLLS